MQPRQYQIEAVDAWFAFMKEHRFDIRHPLILMQTGTGKSVVIAMILARLLRVFMRARILVVTHVKELVQQDYEKLLEAWPTAPAGIVSSGLKRWDIGRSITFAGIASIYERAQQIGFIDIFVIDEAHLLNPKATTMYAMLIAALKQINPRMVVTGFTATGWRTKGGRLEGIENSLFTDVCYDLTTPEGWDMLLEKGYIVPLVGKPTDTQLKTSNVGTGADGDFNLKQLQAAVDDFRTTQAAVSELVEMSGGGYGTKHRQAGVVFGAGLDHCLHIYKALRERGETAVFVHSKMHPDERDKGIAEWKDGRHRWAVNNGILTTGVDFPALDVLGGLRPTKSSALKIQMEGRTTRPFDGLNKDGTPHHCFGPKEDSLIMDFAGNIERLGTIDDPVIPGDKKSQRRASKGGVFVVRKCPVCAEYCSPRLLACKCGYKFPGIEPDLEEEATTASPMGKRVKKEAAKPESLWFEVDRVDITRHKSRSPTKPNTLLLVYHCGVRRFDEHLCFDHGGNARAKACDTWKKLTGTVFPPNSVDDALTRMDEVIPPAKIKVWHNRKPYPVVQNHEF